jgi:hypothetical protein
MHRCSGRPGDGCSCPCAPRQGGAIVAAVSCSRLPDPRRPHPCTTKTARPTSRLYGRPRCSKPNAARIGSGVTTLHIVASLHPPLNLPGEVLPSSHFTNSGWQNLNPLNKLQWLLFGPFGSRPRWVVEEWGHASADAEF